MTKIYERKIYERKSFPVGAFVFKEGTFGSRAFIIEAGEVEIAKRSWAGITSSVGLIRGQFLAKWP